jgi:transposase
MTQSLPTLLLTPRNLLQAMLLMLPYRLPSTQMLLLTLRNLLQAMLLTLLCKPH